MAPWRYPNYLPKPPHLMTEADWGTYRQGLSKQQMSERYSGITSDLIPTFEMIQAQGAGEIDPDPYKRENVTSSSKHDLSPMGNSDGKLASGFSDNSAVSQDRADASRGYASGRSERKSLPTDRALNYLPSRTEMNGHYLDGEGESITVPIEYLPIDELDWAKASRDIIRSNQSGVDDFLNGVVHVSFYGTSAYGVLGQMNFDLAGTLEVYEDGTYRFDGGVDASGGGEMYDFDMHSGIKEIPRNVATWAGKPRWDRETSTEPQPFFINIPGTYGIGFSGRL